MTFARNKKAGHDFEFLDSYEAGLVLNGPEVKQIRKSKINLKGSFCRFFKDELFLMDCHISRADTQDRWTESDETHPRKLLLHRKQLNKLKKAVEQDGMAIMCTSVYSNEANKLKANIVLAKGKKSYDKRESQKDKDVKRKLQRKDYT